MNIGADDGAIPAKLSDRVRAMVTAGLAKLVRRGEPVGAADPHADGDGDHVAATGADAAVDDQQQADRGDDLGEPQGAGGSDVGRHLETGQLEHDVGDHRADAAADHLGGRVGERVAGRDRAGRAGRPG